MAIYTDEKPTKPTGQRVTRDLEEDFDDACSEFVRVPLNSTELPRAAASDTANKGPQHGQQMVRRVGAIVLCSCAFLGFVFGMAWLSLNHATKKPNSQHFKDLLPIFEILALGSTVVGIFLYACSCVGSYLYRTM